MQILIWLEAVSQPQKMPTSTMALLPIVSCMSAQSGETTMALQLSFFLTSSQSCSEPPVHQNESLKVQTQQRSVRIKIIRRYFTVCIAYAFISKAYILQKHHFCSTNYYNWDRLQVVLGHTATIFFNFCDRTFELVRFMITKRGNWCSSDNTEQTN